MNLYEMNREQLLDKLESFIEIRECFWLGHDTNMVKAYDEIIEMILDRLEVKL